MKGTKMTKQECESMIYNEFDKFTSELGESIHSYYPRFAKMVNDMNMIPMSMTPIYAPTVVQQPPTFQPDTRLAIPTFLPTDDPIASLNKAMIFLSHMAKQCTVRKRVKDSEWFKDKMLLAQAEEAGVVLDEEQQDFLADSLEETNDYCDDEATTNTIFMANFSPVGSLNDDTVAPRYDSDTLYEVSHYDTYHDPDVLNSNIQELGYIENIISNNDLYDELKGNNDVISYTDYILTIGNDEDNYVPPLVQKNDMMLSLIEQMKCQVEKCNKETFILAEENRLKMLENQTVVNTKLIDYSKLNKLYEIFAPQTQLSAKQLYWNLNKARDLLTKFDECIKRRTTVCPHEIGSWDQSDIKDKVDQCYVTKKSFEIEKKQLLINNGRLLEENIAGDIMCTYLCSLNEVDNCGKCRSLDIVLLDLQESNKSLCELRKRFAKLEEYSITLDIAFQNHKEQMILNDPDTKNK
ncbi:hypothetical protein Tco_0519260 [Tanacetum coccineum]